jgi:hypothetical protein
MPIASRASVNRRSSLPGRCYRDCRSVARQLTIWRGRLGVGFGARELIRAHTGEGRERAKARGQSFPFKLTPHQRSAALRRRDRGETLTNIARSYNVHPGTISRLTA